MSQQETPTNAPAPPAVRQGVSAEHPESPDRPSPPLYEFEDMRLKVGDRLQIQLPSTVAQDRMIVKLIGYVEDQCLLITAPSGPGILKALVEGDRIVVRIFSGQGAFGFVCYLDRIIRLPFEYLHLSFPREIQGLLIRKAPRVKTEIDVKVEFTSGVADATVANLSATGMCLHTMTAIGTKGDELSIVLPLDLFEVKTELKLRGRIRAVTSIPGPDGVAHHQVGVELLDVKPDQTLMLQGVVHHELARNPYSVV